MRVESIAKKAYIEEVLKYLNQGLYEKEIVLSMCLLGLFSGENTVLLGPPGTAKSLVARLTFSIFKECNDFQILMGRLTTDNDLYGPVCISSLKNGNYKRNTEGFLPTANTAFLDEVFKASPGVLNSLLSVIHEKIFFNGSERQTAPLVNVIGASNETPQDPELEALYDRFPIRIYVGPMKEASHFQKLIQSKPIPSLPFPNELKITFEDLKPWKNQAKSVTVSADTFKVIEFLRSKLAKMTGRKFVISDRRWLILRGILQTAAFLSDRDATNLTDCLILRHCLWSEMEDVEFIQKMVEDTVRQCGVQTSVDSSGHVQELGTLENKLHSTLFHDEDVYKTELFQGSEYFTLKITSPDDEIIDLLIDANRIGITGEFQPIVCSANVGVDLMCNFESSKICSISGEINSIYYGKIHDVNLTLKPKCLISKGDDREEVDVKTLQHLTEEITHLKSNIEKALVEVETKKAQYEQELDSPFVPKHLHNIPIEGIINQIDTLKLQVKDCERLLSLGDVKNA